MEPCFRNYSLGSRQQKQKHLTLTFSEKIFEVPSRLELRIFEHRRTWRSEKLYKKYIHVSRLLFSLTQALFFLLRPNVRMLFIYNVHESKYFKVLLLFIIPVKANLLFTII